jgi:hypothetical protein
MLTARGALLSLLLPLAAAAGCTMHNYAQRGTALGGVTGAGVGAIIGEAAADNPLAGAALGTAVGAVVGSAAGEALDEVEARNQALIQQHLGRQLTGATTLEDTIAMTQSGLSDQVIIQQVRTHGLARSLSAGDLIMLKQQGVSDPVIQAMQQASGRPVPVAVAPAVLPPAVSTPPPRVIVQEHYYAAPVPYRPHWSYHHWHAPRHRHRPAPGLRWGVSVSN